MTKEQDKNLQILLKFGNGLLILGLLLVAFGIYFLILGNQTLRWTAVTGDLTNVMVVRLLDTNTGRTGAANSLDTRYILRLDYRYKVDGSTYFSSRYSIGKGDSASKSFYTREKAEEVARKKYKGIKELTVYYDPDDPAEAVLKTGWNLGTFTPSLIGLFLIACGWYFRLVIKRAMLKTEHS